MNSGIPTEKELQDAGFVEIETVFEGWQVGGPFDYGNVKKKLGAEHWKQCLA